MATSSSSCRGADGRRCRGGAGLSPAVDLRERVAIDGEMLTRTVSIGVALGVPGRDTTSDLLRRADQAVLSAKSAGGNKSRCSPTTCR